MSAIDTLSVVPTRRFEFHPVPFNMRQGSYRGLAATANVFARETHMDALARAAQIDPLEFRLKNISEPRLQAVFEAGAKSFGWPRKETHEGQGFGLGGGAGEGRG